MVLLNKMLHYKLQNYRVILFISFIASQMQLIKCCSFLNYPVKTICVAYPPYLADINRATQREKAVIRATFVSLFFSNVL